MPSQSSRATSAGLAASSAPHGAPLPSAAATPATSCQGSRSSPPPRSKSSRPAASIASSCAPSARIKCGTSRARSYSESLTKYSSCRANSTRSGGGSGSEGARSLAVAANQKLTETVSSPGGASSVITSATPNAR
eukprot:5905046-Prymnesium_polylepis.1